MTLRRVRPPGWPVNGRLSSAEVSALDAQVARALDKSREGDTLEGIIEVAPTGGFYIEGGAFVEASSGGVLRTSRGGRIELGDDDVPVFAAGSARRGRRLAIPLFPYTTEDPAAWSFSEGGLEGRGLGKTVMFPLPSLHDGARIVSAGLTFAVRRSGALPTRFPSVIIGRAPVPFPVQAPPPSSDLILVNGTVSTPASAVDYFQQGWFQSATFSSLRDDRIDRANTIYFAQISDAFYPDTATTTSNTLYQALQIDFTDIEDLRFP